MKNRTLFFTCSAICVSMATVPLTGCSYVRAYKAKTAYNEYQQALAQGDMRKARIALFKLVRVDERVAAYWLELGKLQIQMGDYRGSYDAFSHAHELDRTNVDVLGTMTELALLSGQMDFADDQARTLALIAPNHPAVALVRGYVALKSGELDKAEAGADTLLAATPNEPFAKLLKARVLIARDRVDDAIALLEEQHATEPKDLGAIRWLSLLYRSRNDWRNLARIELDHHKLDPRNTSVSRDLLEALLRAGNLAAARNVSGALLTSTSSPQLIEDTLASWERYAPHRTVLPDAVHLANSMSEDRRVVFANYLNRVGKPAAAGSLLGGSQLPVSHANARWNAVFAQSLGLQGNIGAAKRLFDQVLNREPDQVEALRGRADLESRIGSSKQAVIDAQRLVTVKPNSGEDRLLLARAYGALGNKTQARRVLWQAFQDLPDDDQIFAALRNVLVASGDLEAEHRLNDEFADRRRNTLTKVFI